MNNTAKMKFDNTTAQKKLTAIADSDGQWSRAAADILNAAEAWEGSIERALADAEDGEVSAAARRFAAAFPNFGFVKAEPKAEEPVFDGSIQSAYKVLSEARQGELKRAMRAAQAALNGIAEGASDQIKFWSTNAASGTDVTPELQAHLEAKEAEFRTALRALGEPERVFCEYHFDQYGYVTAREAIRKVSAAQRDAKPHWMR